jgi:hypothetical protein
MKFRWSLRCGGLLALTSVVLHLGFYLSSDKVLFFGLITRIEYLPMGIASWVVSKAQPACFPALRQVLLFEALMPLFAALQGFAIGSVLDAYFLKREQTAQH